MLVIFASPDRPVHRYVNIYVVGLLRVGWVEHPCVRLLHELRVVDELLDKRPVEVRLLSASHCLGATRLLLKRSKTTTLKAFVGNCNRGSTHLAVCWDSSLLYRQLRDQFGHPCCPLVRGGLRLLLGLAGLGCRELRSALDGLGGCLLWLGVLAFALCPDHCST